MSFDLKISGGDLVINNGKLQTVIDAEKLTQEILKICLTPVGSNPFQSWYGSFLSKAMIGSSVDTDVVIQIGTTQIKNALDNLKSLQETQVKSLQRVTADEQIYLISDISIIRGQDPRLFIVKVHVISKGLKSVPTSFKVSNI